MCDCRVVGVGLSGRGCELWFMLNVPPVCVGRRSDSDSPTVTMRHGRSPCLTVSRECGKRAQIRRISLMMGDPSAGGQEGLQSVHKVSWIVGDRETFGLLDHRGAQIHQGALASDSGGLSDLGIGDLPAALIPVTYVRLDRL